MSRVANNGIQYQPTPPAQKGRRKITRQRRKRLDRDAEYLVLRDIYLEENPVCAMCASWPSSQVHHVVRGTAGRARSLLNSDTWLGVCANCHDEVEKLTPAAQIKLKQKCVKETIERLRR